MDSLKYYKIKRFYSFRFGLYNQKDVLVGFVEQRRVSSHFFWCFLPVMEKKTGILFYLTTHLREIEYIMKNISSWRKNNLV